jgi:RND superfamily putative drug exporter
VLAHPAKFATVTAGALVLLAIPIFSLNLAFNAGANSLPDALSGKRAVELLERHFSSSLLQPARVVIDAPNVRSPEVQSGVDDFLERVGQSDSFLGPFNIAVNRDEDLVRINVPLAGSVDDDASEDAVNLLREVIIPQAFSGTGATVLVTGETADSVDFRDRMQSSAPYVFAFVLGLSFLLLLLMFRSLIIPLKAIILNLLSVAAVYGVLVAVFQWGWGIPSARLGGDRDHRVLASTVSFRHPVRSVHGLPHAAAQPDKRGLRPRAE